MKIFKLEVGQILPWRAATQFNGRPIPAKQRLCLFSDGERIDTVILTDSPLAIGIGDVVDVDFSRLSTNAFGFEGVGVLI